MPLFSGDRFGKGSVSSQNPRPEDRSPAAGMPGSGGKYVDDYVLVTETDDAGRTRQRVRYAGAWYCVDNPPERARGIFFAVLALGLGAAGAVIATLMIAHSSSSSAWAGIPQAAMVVPVLTLLLGLARLPYTLPPMERKRYFESIIRVDRSALGLLILSGLTAAGEIVYRGRGGEITQPGGDGVFLGLLIGTAVACGIILLLLSRIEIRERPNEFHEGYHD